MHACFSLVLHAHLPFVRHPEHPHFLEESWLFEAITETYLPLLEMVRKWQNEGVRAPITLSLTPTLGAMLRDPLLQDRFRQRLEQLTELSEREIHRTTWERPYQELALFYHDRFRRARDLYHRIAGDVVGAFRQLQDEGALEIIACSATHAVLPLLLAHPPSLRAQLLTGRDEYRACFGRDPAGIWLPECAYDPRLDPFLAEAGLRWFILDTHGLLHATPQPCYGNLAPVLTPAGLAAFGRDFASARQVWSRQEGYPGDFRYRDFYRDAGFDLDLDYLRGCLPGGQSRTFTGLKYYAITGPGSHKEVYSRAAALRAVDEHAGHFLRERISQLRRAAEIMGRPPLALAPYDAELFGHWWYEGPEFLDLFVRKAFYDQDTFTLVTPSEYLRCHREHQAATPAASSWGEGGYFGMWLNERNRWIYPHLRVAEERMTALVRRQLSSPRQQEQHRALAERALRQAGRELLLAQSSDWPFILRTGTSPGYARERVETHLARFNRIHDQLTGDALDPPWLAQVEAIDNLFPDLDYRYWA